MPQTVSTGEPVLAYDKIGSVRVLDEDGRLKVAKTHISKACVSPYKGSEIPDYQALGLKADKIYHLLRSPEALKEGAESFNALPLLLEHVHVSAKNPHKHITVGTLGEKAVFNDPYLDNSLSIWDQEAIDKINKDEQRELSCAYRYVPVMTPGVYKGIAYDGVMTQLRGNHVALVKKGRAGPDVLVADSALSLSDPPHPSTLAAFTATVKRFYPAASARQIAAVFYRTLYQIALSAQNAPKKPLAADQQWEETLHPRQQDGKFAPKGEGESSQSIPPKSSYITVHPRRALHHPTAGQAGGRGRTASVKSTGLSPAGKELSQEPPPPPSEARSAEEKTVASIKNTIDTILYYIDGATQTADAVAPAFQPYGAAERIPAALLRGLGFALKVLEKALPAAEREAAPALSALGKKAGTMLRTAEGDASQASFAQKAEKAAEKATSGGVKSFPTPTNFLKPKVTPATFLHYEETGGHPLSRHLIKPATNAKGELVAGKGMSKEDLIKRTKTTSASAFFNLEEMMQTYNKALDKPLNQALIKEKLLQNPAKNAEVYIKVKMNHHIGRYVPKGGTDCKLAKQATFVLRKTDKNPEGHYIHTVMLN